jgi:hypothetical protein
VDGLYITDYKARLEQAQNLANLYRGGKFNYQDAKDKHNDFLEEIEFFRRQGRLN